MRLLIVEDEETIARPLARLLCTEGWKVELAFTAAEALAHLKEGPLDAVLIDLGPVSYTHLDVYKRQALPYRTQNPIRFCAQVWRQRCCSRAWITERWTVSLPTCSF